MSASTLLPPLPTPIDLPRSRELARRLGTRNGDCYRNAAAALLRIPALQRDGVRYVEGLVVGHGALVMPLGHGWLELPDGDRVIDPTPSYCTPGARARTYFGAFRWTAEDAYAIATAPGAHWQFRQQLPDDGRAEPTWLAAALAACTAAEAIARSRGHSILSNGMTLDAWARAI